MSFCPNCGTQLQNNPAFCPNCGARLNNAAPAQRPAQNPQPVYQQPQQPVYQQPVYQQPVYQQPVYRQPVPNYPTGGLTALGIIALLCCLIGGIISLVQVGKINKSATVEEQQKHISSAKTWAIISIIVGVLAVIGQLAEAGAL